MTIRPRSLIVFLTLALMHVSALGQSQAAPVLVDEFGKVYCDDLLSRVDAFLISLQSSPGMQGVIRISANESTLIEALSMEQSVRGAIFQRGRGRNPFTFIREGSEKPFNIQFWLTPTLSLLPKAEHRSTTLKPKFGAFNIRNEMNQICDAEPLEPLLSELLHDNPNGNVFAVVNYDSAREKQTQLKDAMQLLSGYPRARVRFVFRKYGGGWNDYWFVEGKPNRAAFFKKLRGQRAWSY